MAQSRDDEARAEATRASVMKTIRVVIRAAQNHSKWIEKQCGVSGAQLWIMQELADAVGLRVGEVAGKLAIHQATASNLIDDLEKRGLILKRRDARDQRAIQLQLTDAGQRLLAEAPRPARGLLPTALAQMDLKALRVLDRGLHELLSKSGKVDAHAGMLPLPFTLPDQHDAQAELAPRAVPPRKTRRSA